MESAARLGGQGGGETRSIRKVAAASFMAAITIVATLVAPETYETDFDADDSAERELVHERRFVRDREPARIR